MARSDSYCCDKFLELDGYRGGVHFQPEARHEPRYYFVTSTREDGYSEYTRWTVYSYSETPMKFCPFCGSDKPGGVWYYKEAQ